MVTVMAEKIMVTVMMMLIIMVIVAENGVGFDVNDDDEIPKVNHWRDERMAVYRPTLGRQLLQPF